MDQKYFRVPFGLSGDQTSVPDAADPSGFVTFTTGYTPDYELDLLTDPNAKAIERAKMNYLFFAITDALRALQKAGAPEWITAANNGGTALQYDLGAVVRYRPTPSDPWNTYISVTQNNTETPGTGWQWRPLLGSPDNPIKIAVIGDSLTAQNAVLGESALAVLERNMCQMGANVRVIGCGRDGHTFYRAATVAYIGGQTSVEYAIAQAPQVVILALGFNDAANAVDGRTEAQIKTDADGVIAALRTALPDARICYASEVCYDKQNFAPAALKNKGVIPYHYQLRTTGILANFYSPEILDDACSTTVRNRIAAWQGVDTYVKANAQISSVFDFNVWKIARLGGLINDGLHFNPGGAILAGGYLAKGMRGLLTTFPTAFDNSYPIWDDPDTVFSTALTASGDGWTDTPTLTSVGQNWASGLYRRQQTWYAWENATLQAPNQIGSTPESQYFWAISGAKPNTAVQVSINGGGFVTTSTITNSAGDAQALTSATDLLQLGLNVGTNTLRYAVGNTALPPLTLTIINNGPSLARKSLTGTTSLSNTGSVDIPHGLTSTKIRALNVLVQDAGGQMIPPNITGFAGYRYETFSKTSAINVQLYSATSLTGRPIFITIDYDVT